MQNWVGFTSSLDVVAKRVMSRK